VSNVEQTFILKNQDQLHNLKSTYKSEMEAKEKEVRRWYEEQLRDKQRVIDQLEEENRRYK
jgi:hypothetical protein